MSFLTGAASSGLSQKNMEGEGGGKNMTKKELLEEVESLRETLREIKERVDDIFEDDSSDAEEDELDDDD